MLISLIYILTFMPICFSQTRPRGVTLRKPTTRTTQGPTKFNIKQITYITFEYICDAYAVECLKAYDTGRVCARTNFYQYMDFSNYCMMDFVNCMEGYILYELLHMGECFALGWREKKFYSKVERFSDYYFTVPVVGYVKNTIYKLPKYHKRSYFREMIKGKSFSTTTLHWLAELFAPKTQYP